MGKSLFTKADEGRAADKQVSLTVFPEGSGSQDIRVEIKRKLSGKKRRSQKRIAAFLFTVMFLLMLPMGRDLLSYFQMKEEYQDLQKHNQDLMAVQQQLIEEKESLYSPEIIERLAREELDMVMPGESKVYQAIPTTGIPKREGVRSGEVFH